MNLEFLVATAKAIQNLGLHNGDVESLRVIIQNLPPEMLERIPALTSAEDVEKKYRDDLSNLHLDVKLALQQLA
jgi:hypothetical protein